MDTQGYPAGWERPAKYRYFPPGIYYIFNTWHNSNSDNRGPVVADALVPFRGARSLKMIVAAGDEKFVASRPVSLNQAQPRLIEATPERIVPWAPDAQVIYEHYHRYLWTQPLVAGRRVLDLGSGEGFGAALLADTAAAVTGVDVDVPTVEHSRANYQAPNLSYRVASATDLSAFRDGSLPEGAIRSLAELKL